MLKISIYGIGNFGYAFLKHLDNKKMKDVQLAAYDRNLHLMNNLRENRSHIHFHKNVKLSNRIDFVKNEESLIKDADIVILAVSSSATREVIAKISPYLKDSVVILNTAKALDYKTGMRLSEVVEETLSKYKYTYSLIAGGTIANDLFKHEPLGVDLACPDIKTLEKLTTLISSNTLSVYPTTDLTGVEYASSFKNIVSIFAGMIKGFGFSYGSETHMISRLAKSLGSVLVSDYGAQPETFGIGSQCWGNDLWMSCTGNTRNREFGILIGKGLSVDEATKTMEDEHKNVEGINTIKTLDNLVDLKKIPEISLLYELIALKSIGAEKLKQHLHTNTVN